LPGLPAVSGRPQRRIGEASDEVGAAVLHADAGFDLIAAVTHQPTRWLRSTDDDSEGST
jgi:hypothetical protein